MLKNDENFKPWIHVIDRRQKKIQDTLQLIEQNEGSLINFADSYKRYGVVRSIDVDESGEEQNGWIIREWAPNFVEMYLYGDFNEWNKETAIKLEKDDNGTFSTFIPDVDGKSILKHLSIIKLFGITSSGDCLERIPTYQRYCKLNYDKCQMEPVIYNPESPYIQKYPRPEIPKNLKIYECHVGICTEKKGISTYKDFIENIIPHCKRVGYNAIQMMAIMEHAYYASFGYQITNYFSPSSRFGTPCELKQLIDECHKEGIIVILDVVHSHTSSNVNDGLNNFDGSGKHYLLEGEKGYHKFWGTRCFDYGNYETLRFLLSNIRYYWKEFGFDGFRFDAVSSMMYFHHAIDNFNFSYEHCFSDDIDDDALTYLGLMNILIHSEDMKCISIAEDITKYPCLCWPIEEGGIGFDYRFLLDSPYIWIHYLNGTRDEDWSVNHIQGTLQQRRQGENIISYVACHDQSIDGNHSIAFLLMGGEMYEGMSLLNTPSIGIDRGIALYKLIKLITLMLGNDGYLTFTGNEFGHPEWLDFPCDRNNQSFHYCRRQFNLIKDKSLRYNQILEFEIDMNHLEEEYKWLLQPNAYVSKIDEWDHVLAFQRANVIAIFNFHPTQSYTNYGIGVKESGTYKLILNSDERKYGGYDRIKSIEYQTLPIPTDHLPYQLLFDLPARVCLVFTKIQE